MPRPIWSGSISFGLVNVPVKLFTAQSPKDVRFNQLHAHDHSRVKMKRFCAAEDIEIPYDEIVKGYEIGPDQYVVIDPKELEEFDPKATHTIDIEEFVHLDQIDPIYFEKAYYLVPDERSAKPYRLLAEALHDSDKVAIARFVMRTKQYLCAVRVVDGVLVLNTMLYDDEVIDAVDLDIPDASDVEVTERELKMARSLVDSLTVDDFEPEKFTDEYRQRVMELIEAKAAGEVVVAAAAESEPTKVVDLLAALEASVAAAKAAKAGGVSGRLIYVVNCSLDGFYEDADGNFDWSEPDEELHRFFNDLLRPMGTLLYGRRLYETMAVWETDPSLAAGSPVLADFAAVWQDADKVVYSTTLDAPLTARTRIERIFDAEAVRAMKVAATADLAIGGGTLAADAFRAGLVDEVHVVVAPVAVGGGKAILPAGLRIDLEPLEVRPFEGTGVVSLRYGVKAAL